MRENSDADTKTDAQRLVEFEITSKRWGSEPTSSIKVIEVPVKLIYRDVNRSFGANLDRPAARMRYYLDVIERECRAVTSPTDGLSCAGCGRTGTDDV